MRRSTLFRANAYKYLRNGYPHLKPYKVPIPQISRSYLILVEDEIATRTGKRISQQIVIAMVKDIKQIKFDYLVELDKTCRAFSLVYNQNLNDITAILIVSDRTESYARALEEYSILSGILQTDIEDKSPAEYVKTGENVSNKKLHSDEKTIYIIKMQGAEAHFLVAVSVGWGYW